MAYIADDMVQGLYLLFHGREQDKKLADIFKYNYNISYQRFMAWGKMDRERRRTAPAQFVYYDQLDQQSGAAERLQFSKQEIY